MTARLRRLVALFTPRRLVRVAFGVSVGLWFVAAAEAARIGQFTDAASECALAALVVLLAWAFERGGDWLDAKAARAEAERDVAQTMADEVERYRDRIQITVDAWGKPKPPPSHRN